MHEQLKLVRSTLERTTWREYQAKLKRASIRTRLVKKYIRSEERATREKLSWRGHQNKQRQSLLLRIRRIPIGLRYTAMICLLVTAVYGLSAKLVGSANSPDSIAVAPPEAAYDEPPELQHASMPKRDVRILLPEIPFANLDEKQFQFDFDGRKFLVDTSIDLDLQHFLMKSLDRVNSRYIGIVAMNPSTGKILAMVGFDSADPGGNPCLLNKFPAASIFKIVTAAAAIEECGFDAGSKITYNGQKHTLYKNQLKNKTNRYSNTISFKDSFAQSVNPVFGKIGAHHLGKTMLEKYALAFGFNRQIDFELPLQPSQLSVSDKPYNWAEIASGFNNQTKLTPLHGAVLAAAILNEGKLVEPTIVDQIVDQDGQIIYHSRLIPIKQVISPKTSDEVFTLMTATVTSGTSRKAFRGARKDSILSKLAIGGKTGSINNPKDYDIRYDWFVGFAQEKEGHEKIAISVMVAHEKYIGKRAGYYARIGIRRYFEDYFAGKQDKHKRASS